MKAARATMKGSSADYSGYFIAVKQYTVPANDGEPSIKTHISIIHQITAQCVHSETFFGKIGLQKSINHCKMLIDRGDIDEIRTIGGDSTSDTVGVSED